MTAAVPSGADTIAAPGRRGRHRLGAAARRARPLRRAIGPLLFLLAWWLVARYGILDQQFVSSPAKVWHVFSTEISNGTFQSNLLISLGRVVKGLAIGLAAALIVACLVGSIKLFDDVIDPVVQMLRTVPFVALTSLFIVWFGIGDRPKIAIIALASFFPMYLNTRNGIRNIDARLVEAARSFGVSRIGLFWEVILPGALDQTLLGLRLSLGVSWLALVIGEQINADSGIGYLLWNAQNNVDTAGVVAGLVTYAALGGTTDLLVRMLERWLLSWRRGFEGS
jgi:sulfonate transport system permease protein